MIFPGLVAIPAEDDREDAPKSHLITKKDVKRFLIALPFIVLMLFFLYHFFKRQADWSNCASNMNAVYKAVNFYANDWDDRFPPLAEADAVTGTPTVTNGKVNTWVTQVFAYDPRPEIFVCPAADPSENVPNEGAIHGKPGERAKHVTVNSSYGLYAGYASASQSLLERSGQSLFIGETSNMGARKTYDPFPFKDASGNVVPYDGFSMGWNDSNVEPSPQSKFITRMAFPDTSNGNFQNADSRHENKMLHAISADGNLINVRAFDAKINLQGGQPSGLWRTPPRQR